MVKGRRRWLRRPAEAFDLPLIQLNNLADARQGRIQIPHLLLEQGQTEIGSIVRQQDAVAIVNQPPARGHRLQLHPVVFGDGRIAFMLHHLQKVDPPDQHRHHQQYDDKGDDHPMGEGDLFLGVVLESLHGSHQITSFVVGMALQQGPGTVELLGEQYPHQWMRQGQVGERPLLVRGSHATGIQPVRPPHQQ